MYVDYIVLTINNVKKIQIIMSLFLHHSCIKEDLTYFFEFEIAHNK